MKKVEYIGDLHVSPDDIAAGGVSAALNSAGNFRVHDISSEVIHMRFSNPNIETGGFGQANAIVIDSETEICSIVSEMRPWTMLIVSTDLPDDDAISLASNKGIMVEQHFCSDVPRHIEEFAKTGSLNQKNQKGMPLPPVSLAKPRKPGCRVMMTHGTTLTAGLKNFFHQNEKVESTRQEETHPDQGCNTLCGLTIVDIRGNITRTLGVLHQLGNTLRQLSKLRIAVFDEKEEKIQPADDADERKRRTQRRPSPFGRPSKSPSGSRKPQLV